MTSPELPYDRLSTTDLEGKRIYLYPADVQGRFRTRRTQLNVILILLFLITPWIKIRGNQAILLDIANRKFAILGITFWAHDAPLLLFVFGGAAIFLAVITAIWGRIWCGWACPQTVFVDGVFRKIERKIEGDSISRKKLDESPINFNKFIKKFTKWSIFTCLALIISHSFLAYFVGTEKLAEMLKSSPLQHPASFIFMTAVTFLILFDFGWFREQFCTIVCPYGRFQSVLMDPQSLVVAYDSRRGEPRKLKSQEENHKQGDCINCYRCVRVCPTGIDIRRGVQMECIACTSCIDACNEVMRRLNKPANLIRYAALESSHESNAQSHWNSKKLWHRPRVFISVIILFIFGIGLILTLWTRMPVEITFIRAPEAPYQVLSTSSDHLEIINHFKVELRNQSFFVQKIVFTNRLLPNANLIKLVVANQAMNQSQEAYEILPPGISKRVDLFIQFSKQILSKGRGHLELSIQVENSSDFSKMLFSQEVQLIGPLL